jgi:murein DD-endopeptidase MepM/ murein hydrolase activator NlpD
VIDNRRHAPLARRRTLVGPATGEAARRSANRRSRIADVYASDHSARHVGGRFKWMLSTLFAGAVGVFAIGAVIVGSTDSGDSGGLMPTLQRFRDNSLQRLQLPTAKVDGLRWAVPKTDRLQMATAALATKFVVHESSMERRGQREYIRTKPYARIVGRLAPVASAVAAQLPPFNPYKLYAAPPGEDGEKSAEDKQGEVSVKVVELLGGIMPGEDGQELDTQEVNAIVARAQTADDTPAQIRPSFVPEGSERLPTHQLHPDRVQRAQPEPLPPNTTALNKSYFEQDDGSAELSGRELRVVKVGRGDTLSKILGRLGSEVWQIRAMLDASKPILPENAITPGHELHVTLVPSVLQTGRLEPARFSVFSDGQAHKLTVLRNAAGEFVASATPMDERLARSTLGADDVSQAAGLYASFYQMALDQGLAPDLILQMLRIHAYETDFRRRVGAGDSVEWFFDIKDVEKGADGSLGELLATSLTLGGETQRFFRYRTPDGVVDYYDERGNTSRKFLMRQPVRGDTVRLASGFGMRRHPILGFVRMHSGADWSAPIGVPIMAAGAGTVEEAGRKGEYGNYIRIRHANGYKTSYAHMSRFGADITEGTLVRQGQIIGYIGNTGLSSGPHLHFEVLVNNQHVDPMSIQVPRERRLQGKQLQDFLKERARLEDLIRRPPVATKVYDVAATRP